MGEEKKLEQKRQQLAQYLKDTGAIESKEVENAFMKVKRELFMPKGMQENAYADEAIPIGFGQTISQPTTIAIMLEMLKAKKGMTIGEVGSGCGYACALLGELAGEKGKVIGVEIVKELAEASKKNLEKQKTKNAEIIQGEGIKVLSEKGPFDRILVSAACPFAPKELFDALKENGRIVAPVGDRYTQSMQAMTKAKGKPLKEEYLKAQFMFVPLGGKHGFDRF